MYLVVFFQHGKQLLRYHACEALQEKRISVRRSQPSDSKYSDGMFFKWKHQAFVPTTNNFLLFCCYRRSSLYMEHKWSTHVERVTGDSHSRMLDMFILLHAFRCNHCAQIWQVHLNTVSMRWTTTSITKGSQGRCLSSYRSNWSSHSPLASRYSGSTETWVRNPHLALQPPPGQQT